MYLEVCTCDCTLNQPMLWSQPHRSPHRCTKGQRMLLPCHRDWGGCWGGWVSNPHSPLTTEQVNSTPPGLVPCIKPNYMSFVQGEMDFSPGDLNISVIFTFITQEDLIPELSPTPPTPYKYTLSTC